MLLKHSPTTKYSLKHNSPKSLRGQMNFCRSSWGGVLWWWYKALPTRRTDLTPSSNSSLQVGDYCWHYYLWLPKKGFPKAEALFGLLLASFQKRTIYQQRNKTMNILCHRMKAGDSGSWKKEKLFTGCWPKRSGKSLTVTGTGGILSGSSFALLLTEYLEVRAERYS